MGCCHSKTQASQRASRAPRPVTLQQGTPTHSNLSVGRQTIAQRRASQGPPRELHWNEQVANRTVATLPVNSRSYGWERRSRSSVAEEREANRGLRFPHCWEANRSSQATLNGRLKSAYENAVVEHKRARDDPTQVAVRAAAKSNAEANVEAKAAAKAAAKALRRSK